MRENSKLRSLNNGELIDGVLDRISELMRRSYDSGYKRGKSDDELAGITEELETAQEKRDKIVERAKRDVEYLRERAYEGNEHNTGEFPAVAPMGHVEARFVVDKGGRKVVALLSLRYLGGSPRLKGVAKCAPNDCFNVHIGKAIALRKALGIEVPDEYLNVPQPTEVRVGDIVKSNNTRYPTEGSGKVTNLIKIYNMLGYTVEGGSTALLSEAKIDDDSREEETE